METSIRRPLHPPRALLSKGAEDVCGLLLGIESQLYTKKQALPIEVAQEPILKLHRTQTIVARSCVQTE